MGVPVMSRSLRNDHFGGSEALKGLYCPPHDEGVCIDVACAPMRLDEIRLEKDPFPFYFLFRDGQLPQSCFDNRCQVDTVILWLWR